MAVWIYNEKKNSNNSRFYVVTIRKNINGRFCTGEKKEATLT